MTKAIVAIGGGSIQTRATEAIDREILHLAGKKHPRLLFIPTASSDSAIYWKRVQKYFGAYLGCATDVLLLIADPPAPAAIARKIRAADIIYVGGGNTLLMMRLWRRLGVDRLLRAAYARGTVLAGLSAGSICWFDAGHSDSMSFYHPDNWDYIKVRGLGLIRGIHCPHFNGSTRGLHRRHAFAAMMARTPGVGIAIDNHCAIAFVDGRYRVITSKPRARAFRVARARGSVVIQPIPQTKQYAPIETLYRLTDGPYA